MAVYKRTYTAYEGEMTPEWSRFLILPRVSYSKLTQSRMLTMLRMAAWFWPAVTAAYVYLANNLSVLDGIVPMAGEALANSLTVDSGLFLTFCYVQGVVAYLMTAIVGPTLISPDLVNNALPLYFCRPFSRTEYVFGKMSLLVMMLSVITWIPGLVIFVIQGALAGWDWTAENWRIGVGVVVGPLLWITLLSLIAMAVSAWVKWRIMAGALLAGIFVAGAGLGGAVNAIVRTDYGSVLDLVEVMSTIWAQLFGREPDTGLTAADAWLTVAAWCAGCLYLLWRKVRPYEVVK